MAELCSVGLCEESECHKLSFAKKIGLTSAKDFSPEELEVLMLRTGLKEAQLMTVCFHHKAIYLDRYERDQKVCCDPYNIHKISIKKIYEKLINI